MTRRIQLVAAGAALAAMAAVPQGAMAAGETQDAVVTGVTVGTVSVAVPTPGAMTLTPGTGSNDSIVGSVLVAATGATGWALKVADPDATTPGMMDLTSASALLPICAAGTGTSQSLGNALRVLTGSPVVAGTATPVADVPLAAAAAKIASDDNSLASSLPVTYRQSTVGATLRAGCNYTASVRFTVTEGESS